jgi:hypothetical protein
MRRWPTPCLPPAYRTITIAEGSMDDSADQLAPPKVDKTHETVKAFVAPVAHESDAVTKDPRALVMAQSVYAAFGNYGATGGLTRNQIDGVAAYTVPVTDAEGAVRVPVDRKKRLHPKRPT